MDLPYGNNRMSSRMSTRLTRPIRWMQETRRLKPSTVSRRFSGTVGFYRTCVIDDALVAMLGLRIFEATSADITDLGEEHGRRVLRVCGKGTKIVLIPLPPLVRGRRGWRYGSPEQPYPAAPG